MSLMSAPAPNARSSPVIIKQRIAGSASNSSSALVNSCITRLFNAFNCFGRLICTVAMGSSRLTTINSYDMESSTIHVPRIIQAYCLAQSKGAAAVHQADWMHLLRLVRAGRQTQDGSAQSLEVGHGSASP